MQSHNNAEYDQSVCVALLPRSSALMRCVARIEVGTLLTRQLASSTQGPLSHPGGARRGAHPRGPRGSHKPLHRHSGGGMRTLLLALSAVLSATGTPSRRPGRAPRRAVLSCAASACASFAVSRKAATAGIWTPRQLVIRRVGVRIELMEREKSGQVRTIVGGLLPKEISKLETSW